VVAEAGWLVASGVEPPPLPDVDQSAPSP
jgi:hypothetical protein